MKTIQWFRPWLPWSKRLQFATLVSPHVFTLDSQFLLPLSCSANGELAILLLHSSPLLWLRPKFSRDTQCRPCLLTTQMHSRPSLRRNTVWGWTPQKVWKWQPWLDSWSTWFACLLTFSCWFSSWLALSWDCSKLKVGWTRSVAAFAWLKSVPLLLFQSMCSAMRYPSALDTNGLTQLLECRPPWCGDNLLSKERDSERPGFPSLFSSSRSSSSFAVSLCAVSAQWWLKEWKAWEEKLKWLPLNENLFQTECFFKCNTKQFTVTCFKKFKLSTFCFAANGEIPNL